MIKALLIGCGNIGAGYDLNDDSKVWTHAKGYSLFREVQFSVFDQDKLKARQIADKYSATYMECLREDEFSQYDIISITTPTTTHFYYLEKLLSQHVPVVICEKPVVSSSDKIESLIQLYKAGSSKVIVNYIRRFQEGYKIAKQKLRELSKQQALKNIIIKYNRGFLNNASHAIDLLEFFFEQPFALDNFKYSSAEFDAFDYDPTLVGSCYYMHYPVSLVGVANTNYAVFDIELFFTMAKVVICHSGNDIRYYYEHAGSLQENFEERQTALLNSYMSPIIKHAIVLLNKQNQQDNFLAALQLNKAILKIIEPLKQEINGTISD